MVVSFPFFSFPTAPGLTAAQSRLRREKAPSAALSFWSEEWERGILPVRESRGNHGLFVFFLLFLTPALRGSVDMYDQTLTISLRGDLDLRIQHHEDTPENC